MHPKSINKNFVIFAIGALLMGGLAWYSRSRESRVTLPSPSVQPGDTSVVVVGEQLDTPWAIAFLPDGAILVTERPGRVRRLNLDGGLDPAPVATISQVQEIGEGGLLGIAIHPNFSENHFVYLYYTYHGSGNDTINRVVRMIYEDHKLVYEQVIVDRIPGAANHNGGRLKFGPDNFLYITTGDAQQPSRAQDIDSLAGKILRVTDEGLPAGDNPFGNLVFSYGHRNSQGLAWDDGGRLWATEHGRSGVTSGYDELNLIEMGSNYGWPEIQGDETQAGMASSIRHSGASTTWAPAGMAFSGGSLFFGGLRGQTLYQVVIEDGEITALREHLSGEFGRLRDVVAGPDGMLYLTTSNRDGRGTPQSADDRIIRVNPESL